MALAQHHAPPPRLSGCCGGGPAAAGDEFICQSPIGYRTTAGRLVFDDAFAKAGSLAQADRAWNDGLIDRLGEVIAHVVDNLVGEIGPAVVHGHDDAFEEQVRIRSAVADLLGDADDIGETFEAIVLALDGYNQLVRGCQRASHENTQGWRRVENSIIKVAGGAQGSQNFAEARQVIARPRQFDFTTGKILVGTYDGKIWQPGAADDLTGIGSFHKRRIEAASLLTGEPKAAGGVGLRIEVDQQHTHASLSQACGKVDCGGSLSDPAFLIGDGNGPHRYLALDFGEKRWDTPERNGDHREMAR